MAILLDLLCMPSLNSEHWPTILQLNDQLFTLCNVRLINIRLCSKYTTKKIPSATLTTDW